VLIVKLWFLCEFDDELHVPNSCEYMGMIIFIKLWCYVLKVHGGCCCCCW